MASSLGEDVPIAISWYSENRTTRVKETHMSFIDLEEAYEKSKAV